MRKMFILGAAFLLGIGAANSQNCQNCTNLAPTGDMMQISSSGSGGLNAMGIDWKSSHGSPSYGPGYLWMWSYYGNGEGVFYQGFNFQAGHTYCITFDGYTRTHDNSPAVADAGFTVVASNGVVASEISSGGAAIPAIPAGSDVVTDIPWSSFPMNAWGTYSYTFTASNNFSQLWFYPHSSDLPQVEMTLENLRICDITVPNPCEFGLDIAYDYTKNKCGIKVDAVSALAPGLTVLQYLWDFGDGTTSTSPTVTHNYATGGVYLVQLTMLVVNANGECCVKTVKIKVEVKDCSPCDLLGDITIQTNYSGGSNASFSASGPNTPNYVYQWNFGDGSTATGHDVTHTYGAPGTYVVSLVTYYFDADKGVCCKGETKIELQVYWIKSAEAQIPAQTTKTPVSTRTDVPENLKERPVTTQATGSVNVFPNPTTNSFTVKAESAIQQVDVLDAQGRTIQTVKGNGKNSVQVSLQSQKTGNYTVHVTLSNGNKITQNLVKN